MDPPFALVTAHNFYDGAEDGLAVDHDGGVFAFRSLGDSPQGCFRAFIFRPMPDCGEAERLIAPRRGSERAFHMLERADERELAEACMRRAGPVDRVGVGRPYLDAIRFAPVGLAEAEALLVAESSGRGYRQAHGLVKRHEAR